MKIPLAFADLSYTTQGISNNSFPYGCSLIASNVMNEYKDKLEVELFKYPDDFSKYLENNNPVLVGFSNFSWTLDLSHEYAKKIIEKHPHVITVFGGPNFPYGPKEQERVLNDYPAIDFHIRGEGEIAFTHLFKELKERDFNKNKFKKEKVMTGSLSYLSDDHGFVYCENLPRMSNLDVVPSPYLIGLMDKFFDDGKLNPIIQTKRGCPFKCTFCQEGADYFNLITKRTIGHDRIRDELHFLGPRAKSPELIIADSNFGMYKDDIHTVEIVNEIRKKYNWPQYVNTTLGKNKRSVIEAAAGLEGGIFLSASVQSTDPDVLEKINRKNISLEVMIELTQSGREYGANSLSEVILCLPGDTKKSHFKSMFDMVDIDINIVRSHQLLMLLGSELAEDETVKKYEMIKKARLQPRCFGTAKVYGEEIRACEVDELCVQNSSMSFQDYLDCRALDLTVEIFYNNGVFKELTNFLNKYEIKTSELLNSVHDKISKSKLQPIYDEFLVETRNSLHESEKGLKEMLKQPGIIQKYIDEGLRNNEQLTSRARAFFTKMPELHHLAFSSAKEMLKERGISLNGDKDYLDELMQFSLARKNDILNNKKIFQRTFKYDFSELAKSDFKADPTEYITGGTKINFYHNDDQREVMRRYLEQYGSDMSGLGFFLSRSHVSKYYRNYEGSDKPKEAVELQTV